MIIAVQKWWFYYKGYKLKLSLSVLYRAWNASGENTRVIIIITVLYSIVSGISEIYIFIFLDGGLLNSVEGTPARNMENCPQSSVSCRRNVLSALRLLQAWLWFSIILSISRTSVWAWETAESSPGCVLREMCERERFIHHSHTYYRLCKRDWKLLTWAIRLRSWWLHTPCYDLGWWLCRVLRALVFLYSYSVKRAIRLRFLDRTLPVSLVSYAGTVLSLLWPNKFALVFCCLWRELANTKQWKNALWDSTSNCVWTTATKWWQGQSHRHQYTEINSFWRMRCLLWASRPWKGPKISHFCFLDFVGL